MAAKKKGKEELGAGMDTLVVESCQAATVVLMLDSPEDKVQATACEAIYRFVERCDENKQLILELGGVRPLLMLVKSTDALVRRHAVMSLGVMCAHPEVRRAVRAWDEAVPAVVGLLAHSEDSVVHEFATLAVSLLAKEFVTKAAILEAGAVPCLIKLLGSPDPDVQKNSLEALAQLVVDYKARDAVREHSGLEPVMAMVRSEYAVIQRLALLTLDRLTKEAENRRALREADAVHRLLDVLAQPVLADLHVMVVIVMANFLEDHESLEVALETGSLRRLMGLIGDRLVTHAQYEEAGNNKKAKKVDDKKVNNPGVTMADTEETSVVPILPDVKSVTAIALARAARRADNRRLLHLMEAERTLIDMMSHDGQAVQSAAATALAVMAEDPNSREALRDYGAIPVLVKLLTSGNDTQGGAVKEAAALAIANLTSSNLINAREVGQHGGLEPLVTALGELREELVASAAVALTNLAGDDGLRTQATQRGVVKALIEPLKSYNANVQSKCAMAASAFFVDPEARKEFRLQGGLEPLVAMLHSSNESVRSAAAWAITMCAVDTSSATEICKLGALDILQNIQVSESRHSAFMEAALTRLLDSNLSARFALYNHLGPHNLIEDGFFDCGKQKLGSPFRSLEDYCTQELNDKRPVLLINAKVDTPPPQPESSTVSKPEVKVKTTSSKKEKDTKITKEIEENQTPSEISNIPVFQPPLDPTMVNYVNQVNKLVLPLPSARKQVHALAQFVSEKMGGVIERGQVPNFSWELPLNELRHQLHSNVVPLGRLTHGIHIHRALLFKALADRIALSCSLTRGEYNRAWNEVLLPDDGEMMTASKLSLTRRSSAALAGVARVFPPRRYIVDLLHEPGALLDPGTQAGVSYMRL